MTNDQLCAKCKSPMAKGALLNSGNSKYVTYTCGGCRTEKTVCIGAGK